MTQGSLSHPARAHHCLTFQILEWKTAHPKCKLLSLSFKHLFGANNGGTRVTVKPVFDAMESSFQKSENILFDPVRAILRKD